MKITIITLLFVILLSNAKAATWIKFRYVTRKNDSITKIIRIFSKSKTSKKEKKKFQKMTILKNLHVNSWDKLKRRIKIYICIKEKYIHKKRYKRYIKKYRERRLARKRKNSFLFGAKIGTSKTEISEDITNYSLSETELYPMIDIGGSIIFKHGKPRSKYLRLNYLFEVNIKKYETISNIDIPLAIRTTANISKYRIWKFLSPSFTFEYQIFPNLSGYLATESARTNKILWTGPEIAADFRTKLLRRFRFTTNFYYYYSVMKSSELDSGGGTLAISGSKMGVWQRIQYRNKFFVQADYSKISMSGDADLEQTDMAGYVGMFF